MNSIKKTARTAGFLYLLSAPLAVFSIMSIPSLLIVSGDAAKTVQYIMASELLFRLGIVSFFISQLIYIILPLLLYKLLSPVNKNQALLMVVFMFISLPISFVNELNNFAVLRLINTAAIDPNQLQAQVMFFLNQRQDGISISGIFWGLWLFPFGLLVFNSRFLPRILGILLMTACCGYVIDSFIHILLPGILFKLGTFTFLGEITILLWLIIKGVNVEQWEKTLLNQVTSNSTEK